MKRSKWFTLPMAVVALVLLFSGCTPTAAPLSSSTPVGAAPTVTTPPQTVPAPGIKVSPGGRIEFRVTDAPPKDEVTSIMVTVAKIELHQAKGGVEPTPASQISPTATPTATATVTPTSTPTGTPAATTVAVTVPPTPPVTQGVKEQEDEGKWLNFPIPENLKTFDLLKIKGIEKALTSGEVEPGKYTQVRLTVEKVEVALNGGELKPATVPSGELKLVHPVEIISGEKTIVVVDFDADKSVEVTGNGNIIVKPVIKLTVRTEKVTGADPTTSPNASPSPAPTTSAQQATQSLPVYPGAVGSEMPADLQKELNIGDGVSIAGYLVAAEEPQILEWYRAQMSEWRLDRESTVSLSGSENNITLMYYQKGSGGAFIITYASFSEGKSLLVLVSGTWEQINKATFMGKGKKQDT